jgi:hypothetical protein
MASITNLTNDLPLVLLRVQSPPNVSPTSESDQPVPAAAPEVAPVSAQIETSEDASPNVAVTRIPSI